MASLLVVDDDRDLAEAIVTALESERHEIRIANHGGEGLERIYENRPDLILLDVQMPALDGPAMVRRLDPLDRDGSPIPIVLMSGIDGLATIAERLGTPFFLRKPFGVDNLIQVVRAALEGHSASRP